MVLGMKMGGVATKTNKNHSMTQSPPPLYLRKKWFHPLSKVLSPKKPRSPQLWDRV